MSWGGGFSNHLCDWWCIDGDSNLLRLLAHACAVWGLRVQPDLVSGLVHVRVRLCTSLGILSCLLVHVHAYVDFSVPLLSLSLFLRLTKLRTIKSHN